MGFNKHKVVSGLWGGLFIGAISRIPGLSFVNCMCCSGVIGGGVLAVYLYHRTRKEHSVLDGRVGVELGIIAGITGTVVNTLFNLIAFPHLNDVIFKVSSQIDNSTLNGILDNINPAMITPNLILMGALLGLVINTIFGLLGGLLGVSFWASRQKKFDIPWDNDDDSIVVEDNDYHP